MATGNIVRINSFAHQFLSCRNCQHRNQPLLLPDLELSCKQFVTYKDHRLMHCLAKTHRTRTCSQSTCLVQIQFMRPKEDHLWLHDF